MSDIKSAMQMVNLGLSIFSKVQTMQHRQIKLAQSLNPRHPRVRQRSTGSNAQVIGANPLNVDKTDKNNQSI